MNCYSARSGLWPPERPRLFSGEVTEAQKHVEECPECREYFAQDRLLLEAYKAVRETPAPRRVRERVFDVLARERAGVFSGEAGGSRRAARRSGLVPSLMVAALAAVALGTTLTVTNRADHLSADDTMFVEDYLRRAVGADRIESSDRTRVARFLARELGIAVAPIEHEGLELQRAEICLLEGRRGAMIVYKRDGELISHYIVPRPAAAPRAPAPGRALEEAAGAPAVITWASRSFEQALVGEVSPDSLMVLIQQAPTSD